MTPFSPHFERFETHLGEIAARDYHGDAGVGPAVRYVLSNGGKRVRPILSMLAAEALGGTAENALTAAAAVEFVHTYSLVHDDLPCMDDDDLRRGKPTAHKRFGEASALLAGDALLTDAFALLAAEEHRADAKTRAAMVADLARAAGGGGMVRGQALDLYWTARHGAQRGDLDTIHLLKTGRLLGAAAALGALSARANASSVERLRRFGEGIGLAFQIKDDLLDEARGTGKSSGKDRASGKLTYLALMSPAEAAAEADRVTEKALAELAFPECRAEPLVVFARLLLARNS